MAKPLILCDVDGVLLEWGEAFHAWMFRLGFNIVDDAANDYSLCQAYGITSEQINFLIGIFNCSNASTNLDSFRDAQQYVKKLAKAGYRFVAISAFGGNKYSRTLREENLHRLFGDVFLSVYLCDIGTSKKKLLEQYVFDTPMPIWVEDHLDHAMDGAALGFKTYLMDHDYNKSSDPVLERVKSWKQLYERITKNAN